MYVIKYIFPISSTNTLDMMFMNKVIDAVNFLCC